MLRKELKMKQTVFTGLGKFVAVELEDHTTNGAPPMLISKKTLDILRCLS